MQNEDLNKKTISKNFIYNLINQLISLIIPIITSPYIARVLREEGNGQYSFSLSIITFFILFSSMGFDLYGQKQIAYVNSKEEKSKVFWEITLVKTAFTIVSLAVLYSLLFSIGFGEKYNTLILILSLQVVAVPFDVQFLFRGEENFKIIAIRTIIIRLSILVSIFIFVKNENDTGIYALCVSLATLIPNILLSISALRRMGLPKIKELSFKRHMKPAFIIFVPTLAITINSAFDKTMIGFLAKNADYENGCYEHAYRLNSVMTFVTTILTAVLISRNSNEYSKNGVEGIRKNLYFSANYVWLIGLPLMVGNFVLAKNLCSWYLGDGYEIVPELTWIMSIRFIASGMTEVFGSQLFIVIGKEKYSMIAALTAAAINVALNFIMIPFLGAYGAAIATAVSEVVITLVLMFYVVRGKYLSIKKIAVLSWKYIIASAVMFVPIYFLNKAFDYSIWSFILVMVTGMVTYFITLLLLRDQFVRYRLVDLKLMLTRRKSD